MIEHAAGPDWRTVGRVGRSERRRGWAVFVTGAVIVIGSALMLFFGDAQTLRFAGAGGSLGLTLVGVWYLRSARKTLADARDSFTSDGPSPID
jgi:hypothetical protein